MEYNTWLAPLQIGEEPLLIDLTRLIACYREVEDRRDARGLRYPLWLLLTIATLAKLAGINELHAVAEWAQHRTRELCALFSFWRFRLPVATTWTRVFARAVDVEALQRKLKEVWGAGPDQPPARGSLCVALDGKKLRGTVRGTTGGKHLLALYVPRTGVVLAQVELADQENEISAAPRVLLGLDLRGMVVTGDALLAQRQLSVQIVEAGGDYLWNVKDNQPRLKEEIEAVFAPVPEAPGGGEPPARIDRASTGYEKGHGRLEKRTLWSSGILQGYSDWPYLAQVFKLETVSLDLATRQETCTIRYGVTSLPAECADAARLLELVREHWGIESGLHYCRDVDFAEDRCHTRMGHAAHLNATLNNIALAYLHRQKAPSLAAARRLMGYLIEGLIARMCFT